VFFCIVRRWRDGAARHNAQQQSWGEFWNLP
jgi:hypothetical protein